MYLLTNILLGLLVILQVIAFWNAKRNKREIRFEREALNRERFNSFREFEEFKEEDVKDKAILHQRIFDLKKEFDGLSEWKEKMEMDFFQYKEHIYATMVRTQKPKPNPPTLKGFGWSDELVKQFAKFYTRRGEGKTINDKIKNFKKLHGGEEEYKEITSIISSKRPKRKKTKKARNKRFSDFAMYREIFRVKKGYRYGDLPHEVIDTIKKVPIGLPESVLKREWKHAYHRLYQRNAYKNKKL